MTEKPSPISIQNQMQHDAKGFGMTVGSTESIYTDHFHQSIVELEKELTTLFGEYPSIVITDINKENFKTQNYYICQVKNSAIHYQKQYPTHHERYTLHFEDSQILYNDAEKNEDYLTTFLQIIQRIGKDIRDQKSFVFIQKNTEEEEI